MAYLALYRKFRPQTFKQVIGQEHIVQTLVNQINNNSVSHAYLFCGTRGTGKTSCAKIFAKAINCLNPQDGSPCLNCDVCKAYLDANNLDIIEIDAASNNRVDEIRDLREKVNYMPTIGKYKVYIIDEVHMLTDSAFNALLKTLEEPPKHVVFILCTTEVHKLPATILSRCTRFDFKLVSNQQLENHLKNILNESNIKYDEESIKLIAKAGQGSVRDTLSTAEMCSAYCNNNITYNKVIECLGITNNDTLYQILLALLNKDCKTLLQIINDLSKNGKNLGVILKDLQDYISNALTAKFIDDANSLLAMPKEDYDKLLSLASKASQQELLNYLSKFAKVETNLKQSLNSFVLIEATLLNCIVEQDEIENLKQRVNELEKKTKNGITKPTSTLQTTTSFSEKEQVKQEKVVSGLNEKHIFGELIKFIKEQNLLMLYAVCGNIKGLKLVNNNLQIICNKDEFEVFNSNKKQLENFLNNNYNIGLNLVCSEDSNKNLDEDIENLIKETFNNKIKII